MMAGVLGRFELSDDPGEALRQGVVDLAGQALPLLDVADDGTGFDPNATTDGYGLAGMRQRLSRVGGMLTVESSLAPGPSSTRLCRWPGPRKEPADDRHPAADRR